MSDVPQMPGSNPFGFDMSELMRMLQSPGPVNMEVARSTAEAAATHDMETGEPRADVAPDEASSQAFAAVVQAAQIAASETTGISAVLTVPSRCVDRATWARTTLTGLEPVFTALAGALSEGQHANDDDPATANMMSPEAIFGMVMQQLIPVLLGGWAGTMIGTLSHQALGQYDLPLPLAGTPELAFVSGNVDEFASEWELPVDELRYALALREVVHGAQRTVPWVRDRLVRLASDYVSAYTVQNDALQEQFGDLDPSDPNAMAGLEQLADPQVLLGAMQSDAQKPLLAELQRFVSVLEGYTDVVVARLGERMSSSHGRIDEALRRHRLERGAAAAFVDRLLGLELDREHYEQGVAFCRGVIERSGNEFDQLNRLWSSEAMVPTPSELQAPGLWLARIDLPTE